MGMPAETAADNLSLMLRVRIDEARVAALRARASECGSSMSALVRLAVDRELSREKWSVCECGVYLTEAEVMGTGGASDVCLCDGYGGFRLSGALPSEGVEPAAGDERPLVTPAAA